MDSVYGIECVGRDPRGKEHTFPKQNVKSVKLC